MQDTIAFIGGGNMARSLVGGLIARGIGPRQIIVADPQPEQRASLEALFGVRVTPDNAAAAREADVILLAVKPQDLKAVAEGLVPAVMHRPLVISIAAGIMTRDLQRWLGGLPVVRAMPNRPALQNCGVTGLYAPATVDADARRLATDILDAVGATVWVTDESQMDAVTAVSGSGPAYFFLLIEMLEAAGVGLGLDPEVARTLAVETAYGAGCMARDGTDAPAMLREQVTSRGGTTEAALRYLESHDVRAIFTAAVAAAARRSAEMAEQLGR